MLNLSWSVSDDSTDLRLHPKTSSAVFVGFHQAWAIHLLVDSDQEIFDLDFGTIAGEGEGCISPMKCATLNSLMTAKADQEIIIASYFQDEWEAWRDYCSDGPQYFSGPFQAWRRKVVEQCSQLHEEGKYYRFLAIPLDAFCDWSERNGHRTDAIARQVFASLQIYSIRRHMALN